MARKKKELPVLEQVEITGVAAEGKALARVDDLVVFVPYVVPGDVVDLKVKRKKHSYAEAEAVKSNFVVATESAEMATATIAQPTIAAMNAYWDPVKNFGLNILNGSITYDNVEEMLDATLELLNSTGL